MANKAQFGHSNATAVPPPPSGHWVARCKGSSWHRVVAWDGGLPGLGRPLVYYAGGRMARLFPFDGVVEVTCDAALWKDARDYLT